MAIDFSLKPYYDDFDSSKGYLKILFKPGYAVQTRELNQIQSIIQNQIKNFGDHVFKNGTNIYGGRFTMYKNAKMFKITSNITKDEWSNESVITNGTVDAKIIKLEKFSDGEYFIVEYLQGNTSFLESDNISLKDNESNNEIIVLEEDPSNAVVFSVDSGIFYVNGYFVVTEKQTIFLGTDPVLSAAIGFYVNEFIATVDNGDDSSLYDNALGSTNYAAPGADRYYMTMTLDFIDYFTPDIPANFIKIYSVERGDIRISKEVTEYNEVEKMLARRTFDESGNYVISSFNARAIEHNGTTISGSITINNGSKNIVGTDTAFLSEIRRDSQLLLNGFLYTVDTITSDTQCTLTDPFVGPAIYSLSNVLAKNFDQFSVKLDSGKAYVRGHEIETFSPSYLTVNKGQTANLVSNSVYFNYGNYVYVNTVKGSNDVQNLDEIEFHYTDSAISADTVIGTGLCSNLEYIAPDLYRFSFNNIKFNSVSTIAATQTTNVTVDLTHLGIAENDAFIGAKVKAILLVDASDLNVRTIIGYNGTTKVATVDIPWSVNMPADTPITVNWDSESIKQISTDRGGLTESTCLIDSRSRSLRTNNYVSTINYFVTEISEHDVSNKDSFLIQIPQQNVVPLLPTTNNKVPSSLGTFSYFYSESFVGQTWTPTGDEYVWTTTLSGENNYFIGEPGSFSLTAANTSNYFIVSNSTEVVEVTSILSNGGKTIHLYAADDPGSTTIIAKCFAKNTVAKYRRLIKPTLTDGVPAAANGLLIPDVDVAGKDVTLYRDNENNITGLIKIDNPNRTPGDFDTLMISQVYKLLGRFEKEYGLFVSENVNVSFKVIDSSDPADFANDSYDITSSYELNDGQKPFYYDFAKITLLPYRKAPISPSIMVMVSFFRDDSSAGHADGYYSIDSYTWDLAAGTASTFRDAYHMIPVFESPNGPIPLRDCIDFRPAREHGNKDLVMINSKIPISDQAFNLTYSYYSGRIDKVVLTESGAFKVYTGVPSMMPLVPNHQDNELPLYNIMIPSWTFFLEDISFQQFNYKRYTMRDIGDLEQRIEHLEYYSSMSLLEKEVKNMSFKDEQTGLEMFKSGFFVESFTSHRLVDTAHDECRNLFSIDIQNGELRPTFFVYHNELPVTKYDSDTIDEWDGSTKFTLKCIEEPFIIQGDPTHYFNVNAINTGVYVGTTDIYPDADVWVDTNTQNAPVSIDLASDQTGWSGPVQLGTVWNSWQTNITGATTNLPSMTYLDSGDYQSLTASIQQTADAAAAASAANAAAINATAANVANVNSNLSSLQSNVNSSLAAYNTTVNTLSASITQTNTNLGVVANVVNNNAASLQAVVNVTTAIPKTNTTIKTQQVAAPATGSKTVTVTSTTKASSKK